MTLAAIPGVLLALVVVLLPGAALLLALGVRKPLWFIAIGPAASIGVAALTAIACALIGVRFGPLSLGVVVVLLLGLGVFWWLRDRPARPFWRVPRSQAVGIAVGGLLAVAAVGLVLHTWLLGLGALTTLPQEHDTIQHSELIAYIQRSGRGAPWELLPVDVLTGEPTSYYPSGLHLLGAVVGSIAGNPIVGLNAVSVAVLGVGLVMSLGALAHVAARQVGLGRGAAVAAGGVAAVVAAGVNPLVIPLMEQGGILANAAAIALTPGVVAALLTLRGRDWKAAAAAGVASGGLVAAHPTGAIGVAVILVSWWIGTAFTRGGLRALGRRVPALLATGVVAAVVAVWYLLAAASGGELTGTVTGWPPDFPKLAWSEAFGRTFGLPYLTFRVEYEGLAQFAALFLAMAGVLAVFWARRGFGPVAAYAVWSLIVLGAWTSPATGFESTITGFFYNAMLRLRANQSLMVPVLAALGVVLLARGVAAWLARRRPLRDKPRAQRPLLLNAVTAGVVALIMLGYLVGPAQGYGRANADSLTIRYAQPNLFRITEEDQAAFEFLDGKVGPGERVMNSANDGSSFMYVEKGIPVVNMSTVGVSGAPWTYGLLARFNTYPTDPQVRKWIMDLNITWVYVDHSAPRIGSVVTPESWADKGGLTVPPGLKDLDGLPGLTEEFRRGPVYLYRVNQELIRGM
ncbi:DUF6541 family protein [Actinokineospora sp. G85]|uniref:DUF6541 family protein n=1 Tax=Actinokineospora sp. G85 TaxID=3406626 RepID=UPI003C715199